MRIGAPGGFRGLPGSHFGVDFGVRDSVFERFCCKFDCSAGVFATGYRCARHFFASSRRRIASQRVATCSCTSDRTRRTETSPRDKKLRVQLVLFLYQDIGAPVTSSHHRAIVSHSNESLHIGAHQIAPDAHRPARGSFRCMLSGFCLF